MHPDINYTSLALLLLLEVYITWSGIRVAKKSKIDRVRFYAREIIQDIIILTTFLVINPSLINSLNFEKIGQGVYPDITTAFVSLIVVQFVAAFIERPSEKDNLLRGIPPQLFPSNKKETSWFISDLVAGAILEEMLCRQFMFYLLTQLFSLHPDVVILLAAISFSIGHAYQGWSGMLSSFLAGIMLGKIFLVYQSLILVIVLHLIHNLGLYFSITRYQKWKSASM